MEDHILNQAEAYLRELDRLSEEIRLTREVFANRLERYRTAPEPIARIELLGLIAYFERYIAPLAKFRYIEDSPSNEGAERLDINIDREWRAFEFNQLFHSVDYLSKILVIQAKLRAESPDLRLRHGMTRSPVYRYARLYYYLSPNEELKVRQIEFASPGLVSFEGLGEVIKELRELLDYIISGNWAKRIADTYHQLRYERPVQQSEAKLRQAVAESKLKLVVAKMKEQENTLALDRLEDYRQGLDKLNQIADLAIELEKKGLANLPVVEDTLVHSISIINRLGHEKRVV